MDDKLSKLFEKQKDLKKKIRAAQAEQRKKEKAALMERQERIYALIKKYADSGWPKEYEALKSELVDLMRGKGR
jgi:hypothetical protein